MADEPGIKQFYDALKAKALDAVKEIITTELYPVERPAQGDFIWHWENDNQVFNDGTYEYASALVRPGSVSGTVALGSGGSFANAYSEVLSAMRFSLSTDEQGKLDQANSNAHLQQGTIVTDYEAVYGTITAAQLAAAKVATKIDYVISYIMGSEWSGSSTPLTWAQMSAARSLADLLPQAPVSASTVIADVEVYLNQMQPVLAYQDQLNQGTWTLNQLARNTGYPSADNGGILTFDPSDGAVGTKYRTAWTVGPTRQQISNSLQAKQAISFSVDVSNASAAGLEITVEGSASFNYDAVFLSFSAEASGEFDMTKTAGTSTECKVEVSYPGWTVVDIQPEAWNQDTNAGFYWAHPVHDAVVNASKDVTGYKVGTVTYNFGQVSEGGDFGLLSHLVISNYPTVKITYEKADYSTFSRSWNQEAAGSLSLFGLKLNASDSVYQGSLTEGDDSSSFTVTFAPSPPAVSVPEAEQSAYVIAAAVVNPGTAASRSVGHRAPITIESTINGPGTIWPAGTTFYNITGSSADPVLDGRGNRLNISWIDAWANVCNGGQANGVLCSACQNPGTYGAHVTDRRDSIVPVPGQSVFIVPLCAGHNNWHNVHWMSTVRAVRPLGISYQ